MLCCQLLVELCEASAPLLGRHLPAVVGLAMAVGTNTQLELSTREAGLEVVHWIARWVAGRGLGFTGKGRRGCDEGCKKGGRPTSERAIDAQSKGRRARHQNLRHVGPVTRGTAAGASCVGVFRWSQ